MSVEQQSIVFNHSKASGTALVILLGIANHDGDGGAWPSLDRLATYGRCSRRRVQQILLELVELGELRIEQNAGGMPNTPDYLRTNRYWIKLHCPPFCDRSAQHRDTRKKARTVPQTLEFVDPVKPASPHEEDFTGGVKRASGDPVKPASPEPVLELTTNYTLAQPDAGAREEQWSDFSTGPTCRYGHPLTDVSGGGVPVCFEGDYEQVSA